MLKARGPVPFRLAVLFLVGLCGCGSSPSSLEDRVAGFWDSLVDRDRVGAQEYVAPDARNDFLRRPERLYRSWEIVDINRESPDTAGVRIAFEGFVEEARKFQGLKISQQWKKIDGEWFVHIDPKEEVIEAALKALYAGDSRDTPLDGQVRVSTQVRIPFFNRTQEGTILIRNGTESPVRVVGVTLDETLFRVSEPLTDVPAGEKRRLRVAHLGPDALKNQTSPVLLEMEHDGQVKQHRVEILFNYISPGLRGILGLTEAQAATLKRGDKVRPHLKLQPSPEEAAEVEELRRRLGQNLQPRQP